MKIVGRTVRIQTETQRQRPEGSEVWKLIAANAKAKQLAGWSPQMTLEAATTFELDAVSSNELTRVMPAVNAVPPTAFDEPLDPPRSASFHDATAREVAAQARRAEGADTLFSLLASTCTAVTAAAHDVSVTRSIITMAHGLQMRVLVEGVETEGQLALLAANRCDMVQGFWFSPPVPAAEFEQMLRADKRLPERFLTRSRRPRTLLLVDDESNILAALRRLLRRDGYHILTAGSAAEGLQRLAEGDVDGIVSDQRMPGLSGVEFLRRAKDLYPETVRIVLSGYTELQSITDAINKGAIYKFLTKPWNDTELQAMLQATGFVVEHMWGGTCERRPIDRDDYIITIVAHKIEPLA